VTKTKLRLQVWRRYSEIDFPIFHYA